MRFYLFIFVLFLFFSTENLSAQQDIIIDTIVKKEVKKGKKKKKKKKKKRASNQGLYNPLSPSKAAFYSAIFPGMGQIYNKKYWKAPIVWGALALPAYYYQINNSDYKRFRTAFRLRKAGLQDEFTDDNGNTNVSLETLETAQRQLRENRDLSLLSGVILYILQIVEASVNAHLIQFNTSDDLTIKPTIIQDPIRIDAPRVGLAFKYTF